MSPSNMGFLPEFLPFFEFIMVFLPVWVKSGRDKSVKIRIIIYESYDYTICKSRIYRRILHAD